MENNILKEYIKSSSKDSKKGYTKYNRIIYYNIVISNIIKYRNNNSKTIY